MKTRILPRQKTVFGIERMTTHRGEQTTALTTGLSRASGTKAFTHNAIPGLKSWAKFTASLRDEDRQAEFAPSLWDQDRHTVSSVEEFEKRGVGVHDL